MEEPYALEEEAGELRVRGCSLDSAWPPFTLQARLQAVPHTPGMLLAASPRLGLLQGQASSSDPASSGARNKKEAFDVEHGGACLAVQQQLILWPGICCLAGCNAARSSHGGCSSEGSGMHAAGGVHAAVKAACPAWCTTFSQKQQTAYSSHMLSSMLSEVHCLGPDALIGCNVFGTDAAVPTASSPSQPLCGASEFQVCLQESAGAAAMESASQRWRGTSLSLAC